MFSGLEQNAVSKTDAIKLEQASVYKHSINSQFYPIIEGFGRYDYSSIPTGMYPVPPNDLFPLIQNQEIPQPFSCHIFRMGAQISMPIFSKSLFTMAKQANQVVISAEALQRINTIKNQSLLVAYITNFNYADNLFNALDQKRQSLLKTKEIIIIKVKNCGLPKSIQYNIDNALNEVALTQNELTLQKNELSANVLTITGLVLNKPVSMSQIKTIDEKIIKATQPLKDKIQADELVVKSEREKLLPSLYHQGNYSFNVENAYNNKNKVEDDLLIASLALKVPIFNKSQYNQIKKNKLLLSESQNELKKLTNSFEAQAKQLEQNVLVLENAIMLSKKSIQNKEQLKIIAVKSYEIGQMSIEDYLKYEDDLVLEQVKLFKTEALKWQTITKLAIIYGVDLKTFLQ
ncbi:MAG: TolC family protein [Flavobacteriia bacterium]|nr:TolC family protein [Flavobacteriia bacterium]